MKKTPIESTLDAVVAVVSTPAPAPRCSAGSEFITAALFGGVKSPIPAPIRSRMVANQTYEKLTGNAISSANPSAASSMPPVENGRAPKRSDR